MEPRLLAHWCLILTLVILKPASENIFSSSFCFVWIKKKSDFQSFLQFVRVKAAHQPHVFCMIFNEIPQLSTHYYTPTVEVLG